jgi:hypothetical protein
LKPPVSSSGRQWQRHGNLRTSGYHWVFLIFHLAERLFTRRWGRLGELFSGAGGQVGRSPAKPPDP